MIKVLKRAFSENPKEFVMGVSVIIGIIFLYVMVSIIGSNLTN